MAAVATVEAHVTAEPSGENTPAPTAEAEAKPTSTPDPTPAPATLSGKGQWYEINASAKSSNDTLGIFTLHVLRAQLSDEGLLSRVTFEYDGDAEMMLITEFSLSDVRMVDASGSGYEALDGDERLLDFNPAIGDDSSGFVPGGAVVGNLVFPVPQGNQLYTLSVPTYEPVAFNLDKEMADAPLESVAQGTYDVGVELHSGFFITSFGIGLSMLELAEEKTAEAVQQHFGRTLEALDADVKSWLLEL